jgi:hypothetical protein
MWGVACTAKMLTNASAAQVMDMRNLTPED